MSGRRRIAWLAGLLALVVLIAPESPVMPVVGATSRDWNPKSFWCEPWGRSGVHKGIDVFARAGTPIVSPTYESWISRSRALPDRQTLSN